VRIGETFVPAKFDALEKAAVFKMPPYNPRTMGSDPLSVFVWFYPQGADVARIACGAVCYFGTEDAPVTVTSIAPDKCGKGGGATDISITGENFPEPYVPPAPAPIEPNESKEETEPMEGGGGGKEREKKEEGA